MPEPATNAGESDAKASVGPGSAGAGVSWTSFTWRHTHKLDGQKRVAFPAAWKPRDPEVEFTLLLWPHPHAERKYGYILGLLPDRFRKLQEKLAEGGLANHRTGALKRAIFPNCAAMRLDPAGRLCLPADMADAVGLQKEVLFSGVGADFEIWDPATFHRCQQAESPIADEAFNLLA
ncbi:MAG: hypothetical protein KF791_14785 [Verrucomicrobiae bacterium]|nr:hypothetical protein [Verrucomicrobiae bacterium]